MFGKAGARKGGKGGAESTRMIDLIAVYNGKSLVLRENAGWERKRAEWEEEKTRREVASR